MSKKNNYQIKESWNAAKDWLKEDLERNDMEQFKYRLKTIMTESTMLGCRKAVMREYVEARLTEWNVDLSILDEIDNRYRKRGMAG